MRCPNCQYEIPPELGFTDLTAGATKLEGKRNQFLTRTPRGNLLRVQILYTRTDHESGEDCFKVSAAPAVDESGDVEKGIDGENIIFPAFPVSVKSAALQHDGSGRPLVSLTGVLAEAINRVIAEAEQRLYATKHLQALFGAPAEG